MRVENYFAFDLKLVNFFTSHKRSERWRWVGARRSGASVYNHVYNIKTGHETSGIPCPEVKPVIYPR